MNNNIYQLPDAQGERFLPLLGIGYPIVDLRCDLTIDGNLLSSTILSGPPLYGKIPRPDFTLHDGREKFEIIDFHKFSVIETIASISFRDESYRGCWGETNIPLYAQHGHERSYYDEYSKYKDTIAGGRLYMWDGTFHFLNPIVLVHSDVFEVFKGHKSHDGACLDCCLDKPVIYLVDGVHRIMSALEAGMEEIPAYVIVRSRFKGWRDHIAK